MLEELNLVAVRKKPVATRKQRTNKRPTRRDDELWKGILDDVFEDFLRFFFPEADELFNFKKKFVFLDKEFNRFFPPEVNAAGVRFVFIQHHIKKNIWARSLVTNLILIRFLIRMKKS